MPRRIASLPPPVVAARDVARALVVPAVVAAIGACSSPPSFNGETLDTKPAASPIDGGAPADTDADVDAASRDDGGAIAPSDAADARDLGPAIDAPVIDGRGGAIDDACDRPLAWWAVGASLDPQVAGVDAASWLDRLLGAQHPVTVATWIDASGAWMLEASATATNGIGQQYFPYDHAPTPAPLARRSGTLATAAQQGAAWLRVVDDGGAEVWIPLVGASASAGFGDPQCATLTDGALTAVIPASAGNVTLTIAPPPGQPGQPGQPAPSRPQARTLAQIFGPKTATAPGGWQVRLVFAAERVEVSFK